MLHVRIWNLFLLARHAFSMGSFDLVLCCALVLVTELPSDCFDIVTVSRDLFGCPPERSRGAASFVVDPYCFVSCFYRFTSTSSSSFSMFRADRCQAQSCTVHPVGKLVASGLVGGVNFMKDSRFGSRLNFFVSVWFCNNCVSACGSL